MKLSAKKRGQIYDLIHDKVNHVRVECRVAIDPHYTAIEQRNYIDFQIAQLETPLATAIFKLIDKDYK